MLICIGIGTIFGGILVDRFSRKNPINRLYIVTVYCLFLATFLLLAFSLGPGPVQLVLAGLGLFLSASFLGPTLAVAADITPEANHATTFGVVSLAAMLMGGAPGPLVTGRLADLMGLDVALAIVPVGGVLGALFYYLASRSYAKDRERRHSG